MSPLKVVRAGTYVPTFRRNLQMSRLLDLAGYQVVEERVDLWPDDRIETASTGKVRTILKAPLAYARLIYRLARMERPDLVIIGYPGWFDVPVVALVCRLRKVPILFDMFISIYDTAVLDRCLFRKGSFVARLLRLTDTWACRLADRVVVDTEPNASFISDLTQVDRERIGILPLGADESLFFPHDADVDENRITFHGTFVPLQGLATILRAAAELQRNDTYLKLIGDGQESELIDELIADLNLLNVERTGLLPVDVIPQLLATSAVVLGIFGDSDKADRVVPNKLYEGLAMARPVVTGDTSAARWALTDGEAVLIPGRDPKDIARAIKELMADPARREEVALAGRRAFETRFSEEKLAFDLDREARAAILRESAPRSNVPNG